MFPSWCCYGQLDVSDSVSYDLDGCPLLQKRKQILQNYEDDKRLNCSRFELEMSEQDSEGQAKVSLYIIPNIDKRLNCSRFELEMSEQDSGSQAKVLLHIIWYIVRLLYPI